MQEFFPLPVQFSAGRTVVTLPVEVDVTNAHEVARTLRDVVARQAGEVVADASGTLFCDVAGVRAVVRGDELARLTGSRVRLVTRHPGVRKVFALTGADALVLIYPTLAAAMSAGEDEGTAGVGRDTVPPG